MTKVADLVEIKCFLYWLFLKNILRVIMELKTIIFFNNNTISPIFHQVHLVRVNRLFEISFLNTCNRCKQFNRNTLLQLSLFERYDLFSNTLYFSSSDVFDFFVTERRT